MTFQAASHDNHPTALHRLQADGRHAPDGRSVASHSSGSPAKHVDQSVLAWRARARVSRLATAATSAAATAATLLTAERGAHFGRSPAARAVVRPSAAPPADPARSVQPLRRRTQLQVSGPSLRQAWPDDLQGLRSGDDNKMHSGGLRSRVRVPARVKAYLGSVPARSNWWLQLRTWVVVSWRYPCRVSQGTKALVDKMKTRFQVKPLA